MKYETRPRPAPGPTTSRRFWLFPTRPRSWGAFGENTVYSVEFYAGKTGGQDRVDPEDKVWIWAGGTGMFSLYACEEKSLS